MISGDVGAFYTEDEFIYYKENNLSYIASGMGAGVKDNMLIVDVDKDHNVYFQLIALNYESENELGRLEDYELRSDLGQFMIRVKTKLIKIWKGL